MSAVAFSDGELVDSDIPILILKVATSLGDFLVGVCYLVSVA